MDRYQKVERPRAEIPISENEVRITSQGFIRNYLSYASTLLQERHAKEIVLKAMGQAISKTVAIAEILKKRIPQLYQDTTISSVSLTDVWEPIEEGLLPVETTRQVSMIAITLSTKEITKKSPGYQAPQHFERPKPQNQHQQLQAPQQARVTCNTGYGDSYGHGRGCSRGRGQGRAWGRGGYSDYYQGNGGYGDGGYDNNRYGGRYGYGGYSGGYDNGVYGGGYYNGGHKGGYSNGGYRGGYDGGYENGGGRGRSSYRGGGYENQRGRGGGGRGYGRGRGQDGRSRGGGY